MWLECLPVLSVVEDAWLAIGTRAVGTIVLGPLVETDGKRTNLYSYSRERYWLTAHDTVCQLGYPLIVPLMYLDLRIPRRFSHTRAMTEKLLAMPRDLGATLATCYVH